MKPPLGRGDGRITLRLVNRKGKCEETVKK
jgi:hypothetical protein